MDDQWSPYAEVYDPLEAGSCDRTHTLPHDAGVVRALNATYTPNKSVRGDPDCTLFVGRLNSETSEDTLAEVFKRYGQLRGVRLVRDIVTGFSRGYAFVEFADRYDAREAHRAAHKLVVDHCELVVEHEKARTLPGWIPRRLGGGLGGKKESGQLRFGGRDRPFRRPKPPVRYGRDVTEVGEENPRARQRQHASARRERNKGDMYVSHVTHRADRDAGDRPRGEESAAATWRPRRDPEYPDRHRDRDLEHRRRSHRELDHGYRSRSSQGHRHGDDRRSADGEGAVRSERLSDNEDTAAGSPHREHKHKRKHQHHKHKKHKSGEKHKKHKRSRSREVKVKDEPLSE